MSSRILERAMSTETATSDAIAQAEALKTEGNDFFKLRQHEQAARAYTAALERLGGMEVSSAARRVEVAVRLNRAWALLESGARDEKRLRIAESDCSRALAMDPNCVKALYRRAVARERLNDFAGAMADAERMRMLEPENPSAEPLTLRLKSLVSTHAAASKAERQEETPLVAKMDRVSIAETPVDVGQSLSADADAAWRALQEEESRLRRAYKAVAPKSQQHRSHSARSKPTAASVPHGRREISSKMDALWALLGEEEAATVAKAFPRSAKTNRAAALT